MQNETQNEIYQNEIKRNEIYQNETKRNKAKWNVTKSTETKRNGTKQNEMYTKTGRECNLAAWQPPIEKGHPPLLSTLVDGKFHNYYNE